MRQVTFKIEEELLEMLEEQARKRNTTRSELIRRAIRQYIVGNQSKPFVTRRLKIY